MHKNSAALRHVSRAALAATVLLAGCSSVQVGREFNYEQFASKARPGTTSLRRFRGPRAADGQGIGGRSRWRPLRPVDLLLREGRYEQ